LFHGVSDFTQDERIAAAPADRAIRSAETAVLLGPHALEAVSGSVGAGVRGVSFLLHDGTRVRATVGHGWYLAWWPGTANPSANVPVAIRVRVGRATATAAFTRGFLAAVFRPCLAYQVCRSGWTVDVIRGVSRSLTAHFELFQSLPAVRLIRGDVPPMLSQFAGSSLGLDAGQVRKVSFGSLGTIWVVPGTEGACVNLGSATDMDAPDTGGGGCANLSAVLHKGVIVGGEQSVFGLVANGNRDVDVCMTSGRRLTIPVRDNVFYAILPGRPGTLYFRDAFGRPVHQLEWVSKRCG